MPLHIITIKLPNDYNGPHDPHNKKTGKCYTSTACTDATGAHHSYFYAGELSTELDHLANDGIHVTRIEIISPLVIEALRDALAI